MRENIEKLDKTTGKVRLYVLVASGLAFFTLVLMPQLVDYDYPNHLPVALLLSATFAVSALCYLLSWLYPKRSFTIANYEFIVYVVSVGLVIHYVDYLNGSLIFIYGLVLLAAAYFVSARNLAYLSGLASIFIVTEYLFLINNGITDFSIVGFAFVLLRVLYLVLLAQVGKNLGLDLAIQRKEYAKINQLNKELSEMDKVKSEFIDVAQHQLKTPLTVIKGNASMILEGDFGKINKDLMIPLKEIDIGAQRLTDIIGNVVDTLKYEEDLPLTLNIELTDLKKIITYEMYAFLSDSWAKNVKINLKEDSHIPKILLDPEKIKLAISIYLENAIKHSLHGGEINIILKKNQEKAVVEIVDDGPSIVSIAPEKLFRRFSKEHSNKEKLTLNLYVVKRIIDSHKGHAYYRPGEKSGNIFGFDLPIEKIAKKNRKRIGG